MRVPSILQRRKNPISRDHDYIIGLDGRGAETGVGTLRREVPDEKRLKERVAVDFGERGGTGAARNLVMRTISFQETFPSTCCPGGCRSNGGWRGRGARAKLCKKFSATSRKPHRSHPPRDPFRALFRSNLERGLYDENGMQLYNIDRHVQA